VRAGRPDKGMPRFDFTDFMEYPGRSHGIYEGTGTSLHLYSLIARYI